jgi:hypothetical protein
MDLVPPHPNRRARRLVLLLLLAVLSAPIAGTASRGASCCAGMHDPCAADAAPCASFAEAPCCDSAPAAAWPSAPQREPGQQAQLLLARAIVLAPALPTLHGVAGLDLQAPAPRLSVVLRN